MLPLKYLFEIVSIKLHQAVVMGENRSDTLIALTVSLVLRSFYGCLYCSHDFHCRQQTRQANQQPKIVSKAVSEALALKEIHNL